MTCGPRTIDFPSASNLQVTLIDGVTKAPLDPQDYRWIIEEDRDVLR